MPVTHCTEDDVFLIQEFHSETVGNRFVENGWAAEGRSFRRRILSKNIRVTPAVGQV